jgi:acetyl/propionyl-CoA carboxylase alpha subunit
LLLAGTPSQALAEVSRLVMRHTNLTATEAHHAAAAVSVSPYDRGGILLAQLRVWRQRRIAALEAEIERLIRSYGLNQAAVQQEVALLVKQQEERQAQASAAKAAAEAKAAAASGAAAATSQSASSPAAAAAADSSDGSDPWQDVVQWVKEHGAVVRCLHVQHKHLTYNMASDASMQCSCCSTSSCMRLSGKLLPPQQASSSSQPASTCRLPGHR